MPPAERSSAAHTDRLIIEPVRKSTGLLDLLAKWQPLDEDFPEIEDKPVEPEGIF